MRTPHLILGILGALSLLAGCVDTPPWLDDDHCFDCCGEGGDGFGGCPHPFPEPVQLARSLPALAQAEVAPVPISGGTMFIPEDQDYAIIGHMLIIPSLSGPVFWLPSL